MNKLIFRLVFPLTFISYIMFYKWWYVQIEDWVDVKMYGFPLINCSPTTVSSMQFQYYVLETIINILSFFTFWLALVFIVNRFIKPILISTIFGKTSLVICSLYVITHTYFDFAMNTKYLIKRDWNIEVIDKGFLWFWQSAPELDYNHSHLRKKE